MENQQSTYPGHGSDESQAFIEIPKPELEEKKDRISIWLKSATSLLLYLVIGFLFIKYFQVGYKWTFLIFLTLVIFFHELGHFTAMKIFKYNELGIFFIPLLGAYVSGTKQEISQRQSAIILLAGPVPGILVGIAMILLNQFYEFDDIYGISVNAMARLIIFLNLLNLLPVYPLDGGQLLHRLFLDEYDIIGKIFVFISAGLMTWFAISSGFYPLLLFPFMMLSRMVSEFQHEKLVKKVEAEGIDMMKSYEALTAEEYWKIRNVLIKNVASLRNVPPSPPYEISPKEEQIITMIQNLLQRALIQDLSLAGKFLVMLIWIACFAAPFLLPIQLGIN